MTRTSCLGTAKCKSVNIYLARKEVLSIIFRHFSELPATIINMFNLYWTTCETLAGIERLKGTTAQLCM